MERRGGGGGGGLLGGFCWDLSPKTKTVSFVATDLPTPDKGKIKSCEILIFPRKKMKQTLFPLGD